MNCPRCLKPKRLTVHCPLAPFTLCRHCQRDRSRQTSLCLVIMSSAGKSRKESARLLGLAEKTVEKHWRNIMGKVGAASQAQVCAMLAAMPQAQWNL